MSSNPMQMTERKSSIHAGNRTSKWFEAIDLAAEDKVKLEKLGLEAEDFVEMDAGVLVELLKDGGLSVPTIITLLKGTDDIPEQTFEMLDGMVSSGAEAWYWVYAIIGSIILIIIPSMSIYMPYRNEVKGHIEVTPDNVAGVVVIPAILVFIVILLCVPKLSLHLATDTVEERSANVDLKQLLADQVTNVGIVSALLLTMIVAAIQADPPTDSQTSVLSAWYIVFLIYGVYFSFSSTVMCAMMLMYVGPLEGKAAEVFIKDNALYAGEPGTYVVFTTWSTVMATIIWIGGQYGDAPFGIAVAVFAFTLVRCAVVLQNLEGWKNPEISEAVRAKRGKVVSAAESTKNKIKN
jgi:uncharacterized membrane protein